jgi:hypothetical protein
MVDIVAVVFIAVRRPVLEKRVHFHEDLKAKEERKQREGTPKYGNERGPKAGRSYRNPALGYRISRLPIVLY